MKQPWQTYPNAPALGQVLCSLSDVPENGNLSVDLDGFPIIVVRLENGVRGFVNACPHQFLPLDFRSPNILSADRTKLICTNHDATFDIDTGQGLGGYGKGCELDPIPLALDENEQVIIQA